MEHIPHCGPNQIRVPYLGDEVWDNGDFLSYLERRGFHYSMPLRSILQVTQTWLFFGLLTEVMRLAKIDFRREDFIEQESRGHCITTTKLPAYAKALARYVENQEPSYKSRRLAILASYFQKAYQYINFISPLLSNKTTDKSFVQSLAGPVMLSIGLTGAWLTQTCNTIYRDVGGSAPDLRGYVHASGSFLEEKMLREGWCPSLTNRLAALGNKELQYVGYTYGSPDGERQDHSGCNDSVCSRSQIDEATYQVRHTRKGCGCELIEIARAKMESIIENGGTPVCRLIAAQSATSATSLETEVGNDTEPSFISINNPIHPEGRTVGLRLEVEPASPERPYLAISHVWADGLGNKITNGLPICELVGLQCRVSGAFSENHAMSTSELPSFNTSWSKWFWMDTLCVPVHRESRHLRRQVITQMRDVYTGAKGVLVLDSGLLRRREPEDNVRMMIRVLLSSWNSRLWTFQESLLAKNVQIVFGPHADEGQNMMVLLDDWVKSLWPEAHGDQAVLGSTVASTCLALYQSLRNTGLLAMNNTTAHILRAVPHRAVTKGDDETICIATLLGLDLVKLLDSPVPEMDQSGAEVADQRMITLLQMMQTIPLSLLFSTGPRLHQPGFRWALKSFLHQTGSEPVFHDSPTATVTSTGLECTCGGMLLISDVSHCVDFIAYDEGGPDVPLAVATLPQNRKYELPDPGLPPGAERNLALILADDINNGGPAILAEILEPPTTSGAAGCYDTNVKTVRFLKMMGIGRLPADPQVIKVMSDKAGYVTGGVVLGPQQKWLIR